MNGRKAKALRRKVYVGKKNLYHDRPYTMVQTKKQKILLQPGTIWNTGLRAIYQTLKRRAK